MCVGRVSNRELGMEPTFRLVSYNNERLLTNDLDMNYLSGIQFLRIVTKFKAAKRDRIDISLGKSSGLFQAFR